MKRKLPATTEPVIAPEILQEAKRSLEPERPPIMAKCVVCGSEATPNPAEQLCWVCRRLKISAWRDVEAQVPAQE
jgi:hypothetical protein